MFLNLFLTTSQVHNYGTKTANHDRILVAQILISNLQSFTKAPISGTLSQISITSSSNFFTFKVKMLQFLSVKSWIDQAAFT